jgi:hypothetical protein
MFLLLVVLFNGDITSTYYPSEVACEHALIDQTDLGRYKKIKFIECFAAEEEE